VINMGVGIMNVATLIRLEELIESDLI